MRILRKSIWRLYAGRSLVQRSYAYTAYVISCAIALMLYARVCAPVLRVRSHGLIFSALNGVYNENLSFKSQEIG